MSAIEKRARSRAGHRIAFLGHFVVYASTILLLTFLFLPAAIIVALAWGIGIAAHGFFGVVAPALRDRWIDEEIARVVPAVRTLERNGPARDVEKLAASLAHEIRNPIAAAKSLVQQIAEDPGSADTREYAKVAQAELDRVESSIAHLLRFAREEAIQRAALDLEPFLDRTLESTRERMGKTEVVRDVAPAVFEADEDKIRRAVTNLLANAADAARTQVWLEAGPSLDHKSVWIRVRDDGPGIDPDMRERVFDPWVTGKDAGTGLGLPIAKKLCEAHGGTLEIESTGPNGTSMLITLPDGAS
ncbi:MAG: ATP-binding protein [Polyangiales bacterium]